MKNIEIYVCQFDLKEKSNWGLPSTYRLSYKHTINDDMVLLLLFSELLQAFEYQNLMI